MDKQEIEEYYKELSTYRNPGKDIFEFYEKRAADYDSVSLAQSFVHIHQYVQQLLQKYLKQECQLLPENVEVLDIACGTGATAVCLNKAGFLTLDGVDGSNAMLLIAKRLHVYRNLNQGILTDKQRFDDIPDGKYDALICVGGIAANHIDIENALPEFIRVLKKGGIAVYTISPTASKFKAFAEISKYFENENFDIIHLEKVFFGVVEEPYDSYCRTYVIKKL